MLSQVPNPESRVPSPESRNGDANNSTHARLGPAHAIVSLVAGGADPVAIRHRPVALVVDAMARVVRIRDARAARVPPDLGIRRFADRTLRRVPARSAARIRVC